MKLIQQDALVNHWKPSSVACNNSFPSDELRLGFPTLRNKGLSNACDSPGYLYEWNSCQECILYSCDHGLWSENVQKISLQWPRPSPLPQMLLVQTAKSSRVEITPRKALACPPRNHPKRINFSNVVLGLLINNFSFCSVRLNWSGCKYSFAGKLVLLQAAINH